MTSHLLASSLLYRTCKIDFHHILSYKCVSRRTRGKRDIHGSFLGESCLYVTFFSKIYYTSVKFHMFSYRLPYKVDDIFF